jgi:hypothetical protein
MRITKEGVTKPMTMCLAWVRSVGQTEEMVIAADSRVRAGYAWDAAPKIFRLSRGDSALCFAGDTADAYPLMLQIAAALDDFPKARSRAMDLRDVKGHLVRVFNHMRDHIHDLPRGKREPDPPEATFVFGGYCWRQQEFLLWNIKYDPHIKKFTFRPIGTWRGNEARKLVVIGDYKKEFSERLRALLKARSSLVSGGLDMEPFEVLRDMLRATSFSAIGGPPQVVKIYRHLNATPFAVYWPDKRSKKVTIGGRPLLSYEVTQYPVIDPDTAQVEQHDQRSVQVVGHPEAG